VVQLSADDNSDLVGGKIYLLDEEGKRKERFILAEDGQFKTAEQIDKKEKIQGLNTYNKEPKAKAALALEDENEFVIDTVYTDSVGGFEYYKLIYDKAFDMYPIGLSSIEKANADLYLTDENGVRTRTFELSGQETGKGMLMKENLAVANSIIKVFDKSGNLVETIVTKEDGSFSYKKLNFSEDMVMQVDENDVGDLVGGIVYLVDADNNRTRFFIQEGNQLVHPAAFGKETIYGVFTYNKLPLENTALVVLDQNGIPIDTIFTGENGVFEFEKMRLDENYSIRLLNPKDDSENLEVFLTDADGNKTQSAKTNKDGTFAFISEMDDEESLVEKKIPKKTMKSKEMTVYFDFSQISLSAKAKSTLNESLNSIKKADEIKLIGHTDDKGSKALNKRVGMQRAAAVKAYLVSQGISSSKLIVSSAGESKPVASNNSEQGRVKNRRVEIVN
jgi:outer membrane protein OmpA-like peptidoglycan-associated protein